MEHSPPRRHVFVRRAVRALTLGEKLVRLLRETAIKWTADKAARLGAALAYYTIFSLAPLLIIAILISGAVFGQAAAQERIVAQISSIMGPSGAAAVAALIAQRPFPGQSGTLATIVSVVTLVLGALGVFSQLQEAFDTVWNLPPRRSGGILGILRQRMMPFGMVVAVGFLLLVATLLNTVLAAISLYLGPRIPYFALLNTGLNVLLPLVVTTLLFAALFKAVPNVHLAWRDLWPGALLTAVLFTLGKVAIGLYLGHSSLGSASGAAGSLLVVLVWVYYSAQILLFGAEFTHIYIRYHGRHTGLSPQTQPGVESAPARLGYAVGMVTPLAGPAIPPRSALVLASEIEAPPQPGCLGALLGFVAGLGAGVVVALRSSRHNSSRTP